MNELSARPPGNSPKKSRDLDLPDESTSRAITQTDVIGEALRKRFLQAGEQYYYRSPTAKIAFTDHGKRLTTGHEDPNVIHGMVLRAQEKGWTMLQVHGSLQFQAEAWVQASAAGLNVAGYSPSLLDQARLTERQKQSSKKELHLPAQTDERSCGTLSSDRAPLTSEQQRAVTTLEQLLRERGDASEMIDGAIELATSRLQGERLVVGRLVSHGKSPYTHNLHEEGYVVRVATARGEKEVSGIDLGRAMGESDIKTGDLLALFQKVEERMTMPAQDKSDYHNGHRGTADLKLWEVVKLSSLSQEARDRLAAAVRVSDLDPVIPVYDCDANKTEPSPMPSRPREQERTREGR